MSSSADGTVWLLDLKTGLERGSFVPFSGPIHCLAASPDGRAALVGCEDHTVRVLDVQSLSEIGRLEGHANPVICVAVTPDGLHAWTGAGDDVRVWEISSRRQVNYLAWVPRRCHAPCGLNRWP